MIRHFSRRARRGPLLAGRARRGPLISGRARRGPLLGDGARGRTALAVAGSTPAADPFRAGQVGVSRTSLPAAVTQPFTERARADASALGLPGGSSLSVERVVDRFRSSMYTQVTAVDRAGHPVTLTRYDAGGRLLTAIRFGWRQPTGSVNAGAAADGARALVAAAGLTPPGVPDVSRSADGGFSVTWQRTSEGLPVRGDGIRLTLWADGTLHALARQERTLAAAPATRLARHEAERLAGAQLGRWLAPDQRPLAQVTDAQLAWVAPNDMFASARPDAPSPVLRLAWVVTIRSAGVLAERWRALELYLAAGDGALLGGDILR